MARFNINEHGVVENPELVTIYRKGDLNEIIIDLAEHCGKWAFGWSISCPTGGGAYSGVNFNEYNLRLFNTRQEALVAGHEYVSNEVRKMVAFGNKFDRQAIANLKTFFQATLFQ